MLIHYYVLIIYYHSNRSNSAEYISTMNTINKIVDDHKHNLIKGKPQLNYCDPAVMVRMYVTNQ